MTKANLRVPLRAAIVARYFRRLRESLRQPMFVRVQLDWDTLAFGRMFKSIRLLQAGEMSRLRFAPERAAMKPRHVMVDGKTAKAWLG
jgi:hypothetical protein